MVWLLFWLPTCTPDSFLARLPVWIFSGLATWFCAKKPTWFLARLPVRLSDWFLMLIWLLVKLVRKGSSSQPELPCATIIALLLTTIFYAKTIFLSIKSNKLGNITVSPNSLPRYFHPIDLDKNALKFGLRVGTLLLLKQICLTLSFFVVK